MKLKKFGVDRVTDLALGLLKTNKRNAPHGVAVTLAAVAKSTVKVMSAWLDSSDPKLRELGCYLLSELEVPQERDPEEQAEFMQALLRAQTLAVTDPINRVRVAAVISLGKVRLHSTLPAIIAAADDRSRKVRYAAAFCSRLLQRLGPRN